MIITANNKEIIVPYIDYSKNNNLYYWSDLSGNMWKCDKPLNIDIYYKLINSRNWWLYIDMDMVDEISIDEKYIHIEFENKIYQELYILNTFNAEYINSFKYFLRQRKLDYIKTL